MKNVQSRNANMDLLRIISMLMVTTLHALGKSGLLADFGSHVSVNGWIGWIMECLSIGAVNIFMLISGYFLINSEFKIKRLAELVAQTVLYCVVPFFIFLVAGLLEPSERNVYSILNNVLPVHMNTYWFITSYVIVYMLSPIIGKGIANVTQKQLKTVIICLLIFESLMKSVLPVRLTEDTSGYSCLWYIIVFMIGAYIRLYGLKFPDSAVKGVILYFAASLCVLAETAIIGKIIGLTGKFSGLQRMYIEYNNIFVLLAAVGIFSAFMNMKPMEGKGADLIIFLSPMALGVYLFQESPVIRYEWQKWFGLESIGSLIPPLFAGRVLLAVLVMYILGTAVDFGRIKLFDLVYGFFGNKNTK